MAEKLVPNLRFAGFNDEWASQKFKDNLDIKSGKGFKASEYSKIGIPLLKIDNVSYGKVSWETKDYLPREYLDKYPDLVLKADDIVLALNRPITNNKLKIAKLTKEDEISILYQRVGKIFVNEDSINKEFIFQLLNKEIFRFVLKNSVGSDQPFISTNQLKELEFNVPQFEEQEKIGKFLFFINTKIELLEKKYLGYQDFKKYLMQQIFTQKLRFNFTDEWKVVKLETLIKKGKAGGTPSSTNSDYYNGDIPFLSIKDMTEQGKYIVKTEKSITNEGLNNSSAWIIPEYSLLYSIYASIGLVAINRTEISTSQAIYGIILKEGVSLEYMYYYLTYFKKNVHRYIETGTQGNLNAKLLKSFEVLLPSLKEQEMIVNILSLADEKIDNTEKEIIKMNEFKKGLLQQMFI